MLGTGFVTVLCHTLKVRMVFVVRHRAEVLVLGLGQVVGEATSNVHWQHHPVTAFIHLEVLVVVVRFLSSIARRGRCWRRS